MIGQNLVASIIDCVFAVCEAGQVLGLLCTHELRVRAVRSDSEATTVARPFPLPAKRGEDAAQSAAGEGLSRYS
jgi:hypothetical protein